MIHYIVKTIICSTLFLILYYFVFEKEKMNLYKRFYLLFALIASYVVPLITFVSVSSTAPVLNDLIPIQSTINQSISTYSQSIRPAISYNIPLLVYISITAILLFRFIKNLSSFFFKIIKSENIIFNEATIVLTNETLTPYSFLNYIFINKNDYNNGLIEDEVLLHELTHVRQKHSIDKLIVELMLVFCWFNPILIFYKRFIDLNHEYLADESVISQYNNIAYYQGLLVLKAKNSQRISFSSSFNYITIKKRLIMMAKTTSKKNGWLRQLVPIPLLAVAILVFSTKVIAQNPVASGNSGQKETTTQRKVVSSKEGASKSLIEEYNEIIAKYAQSPNSFPTADKRTRFTISKDQMIAPNEVTETDINRMRTIYSSMSEQQQSEQKVVFIYKEPWKEKMPTIEELESWKDGNTYGIWIDEKKSNNSELNEYKNTDLAYFTVSRLLANAKDSKKYKFQVNIYTAEWLNNYNQEILADNQTYMIFNLKQLQVK